MTAQAGGSRNPWSFIETAPLETNLPATLALVGVWNNNFLGLPSHVVVPYAQRLAAMQPSRLSGTRAMMNRMIREKWDIQLQRFDVDAEARGTIVYSIRTPRQEFSFIAFSLTPKREGRTGRTCSNEPCKKNSRFLCSRTPPWASAICELSKSCVA